MKIISKWLLKVLGWKIDDSAVKFPNKCIICVAPHTSNWDMPLGFITYKSMGKKASFLMKKDWFFFPLNIIFKAMGGIPVERSKSMSLTDQIANVFRSKKQFHLAITPEGTRKPNADWKKGFYYMALAAEVPIMIASLNYGKKKIIFHDLFVPTGDADKDLKEIKKYYTDAEAKHPENFVM